MGITACIVTSIYNYFEKETIAENLVLMIVALIFFILSLYQLGFNNTADVPPLSYALLILFVIATSYIVTYVACKVENELLVECVLGTSVIILLITLYAFRVKKFFELSRLSIILSLTSGCVVLIYMVSDKSQGKSKPFLRSVFLLMYSVYLLWDTSTIIKCKNSILKLILCSRRVELKAKF